MNPLYLYLLWDQVENAYYGDGMRKKVGVDKFSQVNIEEQFMFSRQEARDVKKWSLYYCCDPDAKKLIKRLKIVRIPIYLFHGKVID